nr:MAG TPA: hypothetical protein [Caudoviricetes sp.]
MNPSTILISHNLIFSPSVSSGYPDIYRCCSTTYIKYYTTNR